MSRETMQEKALAHLDRLDAALKAIEVCVIALIKCGSEASKLTQAIVSERIAKESDDVEWARFPNARKNEKCAATKWSSSTLKRYISMNTTIRSKHVGAIRYYSLADARKAIA